MTTTISEYQGVLVVLRCWCGIQHAVPQSLRDEQMRMFNAGREKGVYCPLGHSHIPSGESEVSRLRRSVDYWRSERDRQEAKARAEKRRAAAFKGIVTRTKRRVGNGVCPCCKRTFQNLARHMHGQHPEYANGGSAD